MRFYGLSYRDTLALPVRVFWALAKNVNRIRAEEDRRMFTMLNSAFGGGEKYLEGLDDERGQVVTESGDEDGEIDREGIARIKSLMGAA